MLVTNLIVVDLCSVSKKTVALRWLGSETQTSGARQVDSNGPLNFRRYEAEDSLTEHFK